jgi:leucyl aminopeptidase (aminopeptidase T)
MPKTEGFYMIEKEKVQSGILNMIKVNMGLKAGERFVVLTDIPKDDDWIKKSIVELDDMLTRALLAKLVVEIAEESFRDCTIEFYLYPSVGKHGTEPEKKVGEKMKGADVAIALTSYSLSHTNARESATQSGTRIASMPIFDLKMLYTGGPMASDYTKIHEEGHKIAKLVDSADEVRVTSPDGTELMFSLKGREGRVDDGILTERGAFGNLPAGEVYTVPLEGTTNGRLVVKKGWYADLAEDMTFVFEGGSVVEVVGGGEIGDEYREMLSFDKSSEPYVSRRNCAELGIGTNPNAKRPDNLLESEKIKGTVHIAIGDSSHMGGKVTADLHQDFVVPKPTMVFDGVVVMKKGKITF